jgi:hypothetical protein
MVSNLAMIKKGHRGRARLLISPESRASSNFLLAKVSANAGPNSVANFVVDSS